jgi:hypothetical protein
MRTVSKHTRILLVSLMLTAFAVRALVPAGFMPASTTALALEICPEGFPAQLLAHAPHHHSGGGHAHTDHCEFGGASPGPVAAAITAPAALASQPPPAAQEPSRLVIVRLVYLPAARGPPAT